MLLLLKHALLRVDLYEGSTVPPWCDWLVIGQLYEIFSYIQPELQNINFIAFTKQTYFHS